MSPRAWRNGLIGASILWAIIGGIFFAARAAADPYPAPLTGFHVAITCDMPATPQGFQGVYHNDTAHTIQVLPTICEQLSQAQRGVETPQVAWAMHLLGHELAHSYGIGSEIGADCVGSDFIGLVAATLQIPAAVDAYSYGYLAPWTGRVCHAWDAVGDTWNP